MLVDTGLDENLVRNVIHALSSEGVEVAAIVNNRRWAWTWTTSSSSATLLPPNLIEKSGLLFAVDPLEARRSANRLAHRATARGRQLVPFLAENRLLWRPFP